MAATATCAGPDVDTTCDTTFTTDDASSSDDEREREGNTATATATENNNAKAAFAATWRKYATAAMMTATVKAETKITTATASSIGASPKKFEEAAAQREIARGGLASAEEKLSNVEVRTVEVDAMQQQLQDLQTSLYPATP